jgi:hypothetical protein
MAAAVLRAVVVIMGLMILAGLMLLGAMLAGRLAHRAPPTAPTAASTTLARPFAAAPIDLPAGARVEAMSVGGDRLVIDLLLPDGNRQLVVIDLATGRRLGTVPLRAAAR